MDLMLASSRSMPDYDVAATSFAKVSDARLAELEGRCPTRVPMRRVAAFVRAKAAEVEAMRDHGGSELTDRAAETYLEAATKA
jgi:hypothetical protein